MHLADGILTAPVATGAAMLAAAGLAIGLRRTREAELPRTGVLAAVFFVASLVHVPIGVASAHLLLNGLAGLILGWSAVPALAVALLLQSVLFQFGGLVALGANLVNLGLPALAAYALCGRHLRRAHTARAAFWLGAAGGAVGVSGAGLLMSATLALCGSAFLPAAQAVFLAHGPVVLVEAVVTGAIIRFVYLVRPETFAHGAEVN